MVRSEDPPGKLKHLRFGKISEEIYQALLKVPGVKSIVRHEGGSKGGTFKEHPHYHVWYESDTPITNQTVRNRLSKLPEFEGHKGQNDWSFRNHDSFERWAEYVCKNDTSSVLLAYNGIEEIKKKMEESRVAPKADVIEHIRDHQVVRVVAKKSTAQRVQLREHLRETWQWRTNAQFDIGDYDECKHQCKKRIVEWFDGWCDDRDGIRMLRFLMYSFGTDALREHLTFNISKSWDKFV